MRIDWQKPLFAWDCLEDSPSLKTVREIMATVPDGKLLEALHAYRGKGRDEYPIRVLWGTFLLKIILRHQHMTDCLAELERNEGLRRLLGIQEEQQVPKPWNMTRFEDVLGREPHRTLLKECFNQMVQRLGEVVPDLGKDTAGDSTHLSARGKANEKTVKEEEAEGLPQPSGGRKEYTDDEGKVTKVVAWHGYKLHLLADAKHEVPLAYETTDTKAGDGETLPTLVKQAQDNLPDGRIETLAYDKAGDSNAVHEMLDEAGIKPLIQMRALWKDEKEKMLPGHDGNSNITYDEAGTVYCYDKESQPIIRHKMAYIGHEPERGTLKYRCPAKHEGWECPMSKICNAGKEYGKTVRVKQEIDLRRFPPIPRATKKFERMYKGRTAIERVNAREKIFWGTDDGNIRGARRFAACIGAVMIVHLAFATILAASPRRQGTLGKMRLSPIARALREKLEADQGRLADERLTNPEASTATTETGKACAAAASDAAARHATSDATAALC